MNTYIGVKAATSPTIMVSNDGDGSSYAIIAQTN